MAGETYFALSILALRERFQTASIDLVIGSVCMEKKSDNADPAIINTYKLEIVAR